MATLVCFDELIVNNDNAVLLRQGIEGGKSSTMQEET
jgi:hypothetical protein